MKSTQQVYTGIQLKKMNKILSLQQQAYYWPDAAERKVIAKTFLDKHHVPNVVAVGNGTLFPLFLNHPGRTILILIGGKVNA